MTGAGSPKAEYCVVIPSHNHTELLIRCMDALRHHSTREHDILIMDDSADESTKAYLRGQTLARVIEPPEPYGSMNAVLNHAFDSTDHEYVAWVCNNAMVEPEWDQAAIRVLQDSLNIGIMGFKILYPRTSTIEHAGCRYKPDATIYDYGRHAPGHRFTFLREVPTVGFTVAMLRRSALPLPLRTDEYPGFAAYDDLDLCLEVRQRGYIIMYCGYGVAYHETKATALEALASGQMSRETWESKIHRAREVFRQKWCLNRDVEPETGFITLEESNRRNPGQGFVDLMGPMRR